MQYPWYRHLQADTREGVVLEPAWGTAKEWADWDPQDSCSFDPVVFFQWCDAIVGPEIN